MSNKLPRVVAVIDDSKVVLSCGQREGLRIGDKFLIYGEGDEITDPETDEDLGIIELVRGRVKVTHLQEKLATAESIEKTVLPPKKRIISVDP